MDTGKTSIIMTALNESQLQVHITSAAIGNISKYTNREDYELILVDQKPDNTNKRADLNHRHNHIDIDKHIKLDSNIGMSAAMNLGYKNSNPDYPYVCFIHNDVFVWEGWLDVFKELLQKKPEGIFMPTQGPYKREDILKIYQEENPKGNDDAGMVVMAKETFKETGGWDERFKGVCQDAAFRARFPSSYFPTGKVIITHIGAINMYTEEEHGREGIMWVDLKNNSTGKYTNYL